MVSMFLEKIKHTISNILYRCCQFSSSLCSQEFHIYAAGTVICVSRARSSVAETFPSLLPLTASNKFIDSTPKNLFMLIFTDVKPVSLHVTKAYGGGQDVVYIFADL
jgi:hypothetical protein